MIVDWQRGNIPYFVPPPKTEEEQEKEEQKMVELEPGKKNPIMEAAENQQLTDAQNEILAGLSKIDTSQAPADFDQIES